MEKKLRIRNELYDYLKNTTKANLLNWLKTRASNETKLEIVQQLRLFALEINKWASKLEEEYKKTL